MALTGIPPPKKKKKEKDLMGCPLFGLQGPLLSAAPRTLALRPNPGDFTATCCDLRARRVWWVHLRGLGFQQRGPKELTHQIPGVLLGWIFRLELLG